ncbi:pyrimidine-nucleoside phosphorylase [Sinanaerobacter sp. ZZT-01]|uniref:pyrimidine-nucleoside phosphorylase n=1 Tax=Sinanaerobacter sp. ZZT-01 TaxID=3111540 RepID=UPI002D78EC13|nr:pyrimidine-nucleoside phosphorylase [Sinanaerobacter sp. ZZT-01]WRR93296.1 pyrimidine-nucleoside phosphorylase [Sinanaerobacter sp. ZZT-01]
MNMNDMILKKREGKTLTREEIQFFISGYTKGVIPDYQAAALLMAIFFQKLTDEETFYLTEAMQHSGDIIDLSAIKGIKVDKHSTGGVGDKTTLIVAPIAAACGVPIAKMSGRGLGFTGGTIDKLESIPGFRTVLEPEEFVNQVNEIGLSVIGQTAHIAAADKKLYALRDVTATVDNASLITSSIMSKKLAAGSDAIILDVKCGKGAFMEEMEEAEHLANLMVSIGKSAGKKTIAIITDMNQPLGNAVGNSLEVQEAINTLKGDGPKDIEELCLRLASYMIFVGEKADSPEHGYQLAQEALDTGSAYRKFLEFVERQGGIVSKEHGDISLSPAAYESKLFAKEEGYLLEVEAKKIGVASQHTGAGRETKEDTIDLSAGILLHKKIGDAVKKGECLATVYGNREDKVQRAMTELEDAFTFSKKMPRKISLIKKIIE